MALVSKLNYPFTIVFNSYFFMIVPLNVLLCCTKVLKETKNKNLKVHIVYSFQH